MRVRLALNVIGSSLLGLCFLVSTVRIARTAMRESGGNTGILRFAHTNLETGVREALNALVDDYMALHPEVTVRQMTVPDRVYGVWMQTKLFGGNVPDIVELQRGVTDNDDLLGYFLPLAKYVEQPNPYNKGTSLEKARWRDTFFDGLSNSPSYNKNLLNTFGVPNTIFTVRVFYNRDLLREITGTEDHPVDFRQFVDLCRQIKTHATAAGISISPLAGSRESSDHIFNRLFGSQTQRLAMKLEPTNELLTRHADITVAYLADKWTLRDPEVLSGFGLIKLVGDFFTPGFQQLRRDDAVFQFTQEAAVMIVSGSYDSNSIKTQAPFDVGVFNIPMPKPGDDFYGAFALGLMSEANLGGQAAFAVHKFSPRTEQAVDFLQFITSKQSNRKFSTISGWLPAVIEIDAAPDLRPFMPVIEGYATRFLINRLGSDVASLINADLHRLFGPDGNVDDFIDAIEPKMRRAITTSVVKSSETVMSDAAYFDSMLGALHRRSLVEGPVWEERISEILESQIYQEEVSFFRHHEVLLYGEE